MSTMEIARFQVSETDVEAFHRDGHLTVPNISPPDEVLMIRQLYDRLFAERKGWNEGDLTDFAGVDDPEKQASVPQLLSPSRYEPLLIDTEFRRNSFEVAKQLLGPNAQFVFEHAMLKPPRTGGSTPWHQDESFYERFTNYKSITFWMPLQDVAEINGCMSFIDGSHKGPLLPHQRIGNDPRIHGLEAIGVDDKTAKACVLPAGWASVHHALMLHSAGPNRSDVPRRAYALGFGVKSRDYTLRQDHPWNLGKLTDRKRRAESGFLNRSISTVKTAVKAVIR